MREEVSTEEEQREEALEILARDPKVDTAAKNLDRCIDEFIELQQEILPQQEKGLVIPNVEERIFSSQSKLADCIDALVSAMKECEDMEVIQVAMGVHSVGVQYFQGVFFGIHYSRMAIAKKGDRIFARLLHSAYAQLNKTRQQKSGLVIPK